MNYTDSGILYDIASVYNLIFGSIGVEIFLFLSGMGLFFSMRKNENVLCFYKKRLKRLSVPYVLIGGIYWII